MIDIIKSAWFIIPVSLIAIILAISVIKRCTKSIFYSKIISDPGNGVGYVCDILANEYSSKNVLRDIKLISVDSIKNSSEYIKPTSDVIFVGKCGVVLISVITEKGEYDNPKTGMWRQRFVNKSGEEEIRQIANPFDSTVPQLRVVSELLNNEGIYQKCVKRLVVCTQAKTRFTYSYPEIAMSDEMIAAINEFGKESSLTAAEIRAAKDAISGYSEYLTTGKKQ